MRKKEKKELHPALKVLKGFSSLIVLAVILVLSIHAFKFCMSLFATGDYIVTLPGQDSPVVYKSSVKQEHTQTPVSTELGEVVEVSRATIAVAGDLMTHMPIVTSGTLSGGSDYSYIFNYVSSYITGADYAVVNLETTLSGTENGNEYTGYPYFNAPDTIADGAKSGGFDMLLTGNNHCNDYGTFGLKRTLDILKNRQLDTLGTTGTAEEADYVVKEVGGIKVGMICYTYGEISGDADRPSLNGLPTDATAAGLINAFDYDKLDDFYSQMTTHIANMKAAGAETIVLYIHWGDEFTTRANDNQRAIAQKMCDLGVDIIAGGHPHVVQPMELLTSSVDAAHKTICLYSMGNFLSNQRSTNISLTTGHSEDSVVLTFTLVKYSDGSVCVDSVQLLPTWVLVRGSGDKRTYHILPLDNAIGDWKTYFSLTDEQLEEAKKSYNRTAEIITAGLKEVQDYLSAEKIARHGDIVASNGVG